MADLNNFIDQKLVDSLTAINEQLVKAGTNIDNLIPSIKKLEEAQSKLGKETTENNNERKKLTANEKAALSVAKQLEANEAKLNQLRTEAGKKLIAQRVEIQKVTTATKQNLTSTNALTGSYLKINAELNKNITKYKSLSEEQRKNKSVGGQLLTTIQKQDKALKSLDSQMGRSQRNVGNYASAFRSLIGAFGVTGGILGFVTVLRNAGKTIAQFDQAQATTAATLGKTKDEIVELTESAIELGRVTQFTATEVSVLQNELAKLGFVADEITASTAGILDFAAATGAGLGESAKVAGQALRAFGLDASEMDRVVSVLAVATTKSALSFADFETGLSNVAPVAKAFGFSIEDTVALFGKLRDAGFDASKATTATRNIILNLADANGALSKSLGGNITNFDEFIPAMVQLRDSGVDLNTTLELTDKRSVAAFNTFLNSAESAKTLRDSITDVNSELSEMVTTKTDNVVGASARVASAWEGVLLKFRESSGVFKDALDGLAGALNLFANENLSYWDKTFFFIGAKRQAMQDEFSKKLRTASIEDVRFTIAQNEEKLSNGSKFDKHLLQMAKDRLAALEKAEKASTERVKTEKEKAEQEKVFLEEESAKKAAKKAEKERVRAEKETNEKIQKEREKHHADLLRESEKFLSMDSKLQGKRIAEEKTIRRNNKGENQKLEIDDLAQRNKNIEKQADIDQTRLNEASEKKKSDEEAVRDAAIQGAATLGNTLFDLKTAGLKREFDAAEGNAKKQAEISKKIAQQEKKKALFGIAINTALAVVKALPNIPLSIIVGGLGLASAAAVAARPIPQFAKGTNYSPAGLAELAERGRELVQNPNGEVWMAENRGLYNLQQGSKVLTNQKTEAILNDGRMVQELKLTRKAIQRQPRGRSESQFSKRQRGYRDGYHSYKNRLN